MVTQFGSLPQHKPSNASQELGFTWAVPVQQDTRQLSAERDPQANPAPPSQHRVATSLITHVKKIIIPGKVP